MKATIVTPRFFKSGSASHISSRGDPTTKEQSTAELLKWISDVTIKRRRIRKSTHCSNLHAEAVLSSMLRQAKKELAQKQEEKRQRIRQFCAERQMCRLARENSVELEFDSDFELVKNPTTFATTPVSAAGGAVDKSGHGQTGSENSISNPNPPTYKVTCILKEVNGNHNQSSKSHPSSGSRNDNSSISMQSAENFDGMDVSEAEADDEVKAAMSSLDLFFQELKSVQVIV